MTWMEKYTNPKGRKQQNRRGPALLTTCDVSEQKRHKASFSQQMSLILAQNQSKV